jgi:hypothetical protein
LSERLRQEIPQGDGPRVRHAFRVCLGREPTREEFQKVQRYLDNAPRGGAPATNPMAGSGQAPGRDPGRDRDWVGLARALLNLDEFITRE